MNTLRSQMLLLIMHNPRALHLQAHPSRLLPAGLRCYVTPVHPRVEPGVVAGGQICDHCSKIDDLLHAAPDALLQHTHGDMLHKRVHGNHKIRLVFVIHLGNAAPHDCSRGSHHREVHQAGLQAGHGVGRNSSMLNALQAGINFWMR